MTGLVAVPDEPGFFYVGALSESEGGLFLAEVRTTSPVAFSWAGIEFSTASPFKPRRVTGWEDPPDGEAPDEPVAGRHGSRRTSVTRRRRVVEIEGSCTTRGARDQLFRMLGDALSGGFGEGEETSPLVGSIAGRELTSEAQLLRYKPTLDPSPWGMGVWTWALQLVCPDPLRYGVWERANSALATAGTGMALPASLPAAFPANPVGGALTVLNRGNTRTPGIFTITGPVVTPGLVVNAGTRWQAAVNWDTRLLAGDALVIDTARGGAMRNGVYAAPAFGSALVKDLELRPGVNSVAAAGNADMGSTLVATFRPAYW